jgi:hypothetical protein
MIPVMFDRDYIDDLQDYYHCNECIREQQYLSPEKLLHLAAFCVSKAATDVNENSESRRHGPKAEAALDVVRQLELLCENAVWGSAQLETVTVVTGQTNGDRETRERHRTTAVPPTMTESCDGDLGKLREAVNSTLRDLVRRLNICWKTPRV